MIHVAPHCCQFTNQHIYGVVNYFLQGNAIMIKCLVERRNLYSLKFDFILNASYFLCFHMVM